MKGGLAAYLVAAEAVADGRARGDLIFSSVIEEECGGNGMWSVAARRLHGGRDADRRAERPRRSIHAGTGVVWARLTARGAAGHAAYTGGDGPVRRARARGRGDPRRRGRAERPRPTTPSSRAVSRVAVRDDGRPHRGRRLDVVGAARRSQVAGALRPRARAVDPAEVQQRIEAAVAEAAPAVEVEFEAFRARRLLLRHRGPAARAPRADARGASSARAPAFDGLDGDDRRALRRGRASATGRSPGNLHGADEWVDVASLETVARVVALTRLALALAGD